MCVCPVGCVCVCVCVCVCARLSLLIKCQSCQSNSRGFVMGFPILLIVEVNICLTVNHGKNEKQPFKAVVHLFFVFNPHAI